MIRESLCEVTVNHVLARGIWELQFEAGSLAEAYQGAGQFIEILIDRNWEHPLRRPMSIASVRGSVMSIIYKVMGPATTCLTKLVVGEKISVIGPLGNCFSAPDEGQIPVLIGGGVGLAPILNLRDELIGKNSRPITILGARSGDEHFLKHNPAAGIILTTDDGSLGEPGTVVPALIGLLKSTKNPWLAACGPEPMLRAIQSLADEYGLPAELSVESYMGCGLGICQGCAIRRANGAAGDHSYHRQYSLVCIDGPVYSSGEVRFD